MAAALGWAAPAPAVGLTPTEVVVVVNERSPLSVEIGEHYRRARRIPARQVVRIRTALQEEIDRATYRREIELPLAAFLVRHQLVDRIAAIVLTKGVPLKIEGSGGQDGTRASVDAELALLYRTLVQGPLPPAGRLPNPYFRPDAPAPFRRSELDLYLVTRLDGYTAADVHALIDRGLQPARFGTIVLDGKGDGAGAAGRGETWLRRAAERLAESGLEIRLDADPTPIVGATDVLGYAGWGSNDPAIRRRTPGFRWVPGALASWFVSTSARTFAPPPKGWTPGAWDDGGRQHAGSAQSLIGDLVAEGVTGTVGFVNEPYLDGTARPDIFLPAYRAGYTLAESFYMSLRHLSWQSVVIGDPLVAPFGALVGDRPPPPPGMTAFLERRSQALEAALDRAESAELRRTLARVHAERARELMQARRPDEALAAAKQAVEADADEPGALYALGVVHAARGERDRAAAVFHDLVRRHPESPLAERARRRLEPK